MRKIKIIKDIPALERLAFSNCILVDFLIKNGYAELVDEPEEAPKLPSQIIADADWVVNVSDLVEKFNELISYLKAREALRDKK